MSKEKETAVSQQEQTQTKATAVAKKDYGSMVVALVNERMKEGLTLPKDYNAVNAIKCSMIALTDLCDRNGRHFTEVCTPASIQTALFKMVTKGLDVSKQQGYMVIRGNQLCFDDEYFGKICQIRRIYPDWQPVPHVVYKGDVFEYGIDPETGYTKLVKHEQKLENRNPNEWVGGYIYLPTADGKRDLYVMSRYEVEAAWSQSRNTGLNVHKKFLEKMVGKTLINTGATRILNPTDSASAPIIAEPQQENENTIEDADVEVIDVTGVGEEVASDNNDNNDNSEASEQSVEELFNV